MLQKPVQLILLLASLLAGAQAGCGDFIVRSFLGSPPKQADESGGRRVGRTRYERPELSYEVGDPGEPWAPQPESEGNLAFFAPAHGALIACRSTCARFSDAPLERLARDLLLGLNQRKILREERVAFSGREGLDLEAAGKLDGVAVAMWVRVLKKRRCIFDFSLVAPPERFDRARGAFERFLAGFKITDDG